MVKIDSFGVFQLHLAGLPIAVKLIARDIPFDRTFWFIGIMSK